MMNMMTGAVVINGGVGVMEIHQPQVAVSQMAASAAQAAEQVALNAHITLRELKGMIDTVVEKKLPTFKTLMEMNPVAVARTSVNGAKLTAYENGYAVYEVDSAHTVMAVDRCGDYRYDFTDGTHQIVPAETFEDAEWSLRLLMEGEKRMEHNLSKTAAKFEQVPLECDGSDWSASIMVDFLDEDNAEMLADRELRCLYAAMRWVSISSASTCMRGCSVQPLSTRTRRWKRTPTSTQSSSFPRWSVSRKPARIHWSWWRSDSITATWFHLASVPATA